MFTQVIDRLAAEFGASVKATKYVLGWEPRPDVGMAVERESRKARGYVCVWVPHPGPSEPLPANATVYGATEGRHSNAYSLPGLRKGMPALRIRVETLSQLEELVRFVRGLPPIRSHA